MIKRAYSLLEVHWQFAEDAISWIEDHTVDARRDVIFDILPRLAGLLQQCPPVLIAATLHDTRLVDIEALLDHIQLDQSAVELVLIFDQVEVVLVQSIHISDQSQPVLQSAQVLSRGRSLDCSAFIMTSHNDISNFKVPDCELQHR